MSQSANDRSATDRRYLFLTVFVAGMSTLAVEFTASRLLQAVYGTSNIVWANVIGLVLLSLTIGYFIGGRLADRRPDAFLFYALVSVAGFAAVFFLLLTSVVLRGAAGALAALNVGAVAGSLLLVVLALVVPVTLLGCLSPFAVRLAVRDVAEAGRVSGRIYAVSTLGSLLGTYLPVPVSYTHLDVYKRQVIDEPLELAEDGGDRHPGILRVGVAAVEGHVARELLQWQVGVAKVDEPPAARQLVGQVGRQSACQLALDAAAEIEAEAVEHGTAGARGVLGRTQVAPLHDGAVEACLLYTSRCV